MSTLRSLPTPVRTATPERLTLANGRTAAAHVWPGVGAPIVLLHGLLDSAEGWADFCRATRRPCVAVDLAGFGDSSLPSHPAFSSYASDVLALLDDLVAGPALIVGHSLGGAVATALVDRRPELAHGLVLLAPAGFGRIPLAEAISVPGVRTVAGRVLPAALGNRFVVGGAYRWAISAGVSADAALLERVSSRRSAGARAAEEATKAVVRGGLSARAFHRRRIAFDGPVTAIWGTRDLIVPRSHLAGVLVAFPDAAHAVWEGMGHHPQRERPAQLAAVVESMCGAARAGRRARRRPKAGPPTVQTTPSASRPRAVASL